ncbi:sirohydrochlorin cobaltochelatase [Marinifilum sp.]|uniref:sirohydrochlorin cobaltochelatase n=1 Tax=Marinifilum sp. TaxID=2033137 RepID=UPI003BAB78F8
MRLFIVKIFILSLLTMSIQEVSAHKKIETNNGILLVTFGTSYPEARVAFANIEKKVKDAFPDVEVRWAYTSKIIRRILKKRGNNIDSPSEALAKMGEEGFTHIAVQSLHVIPGEEFENLKLTVNAFNKMPKGIQIAKLGNPLLFLDEDNQAMASFLDGKFADITNSKSALLFMGHGTHHAANIYYPGFQYYLQQKSDKYFLGTVEGYPMLEQIIPQLKAQKIKKVVLTPFMTVAGDHARNDMAGDEDDSWKTILEKEGFEVECILKGMAEYDDVVNIWINHLKKVYENL